jgi:uncharacterized protein with ParB-like and HNH nuclease domain
MPATVKLQLSFETLIEAISSLDLEEKQQLQEIIEQQIFEEEDEMEQNPQVLAEIAEARKAYQDGDYQTIQEYVASRAQQKT